MIKILQKNPGIFFKDNSYHEFDKYREFIEEQLSSEVSVHGEFL